VKGHKLRIGVVALAALAVLGLGACDWRPVLNPPPGGGEIITETFRLGPYDLGPGQDKEAVVPAPRPSGDFGIVGMRFRVVDENGTVQSMMDGIHLHHIVMINNANKDALCSSRSERFGGSGMEQTPMDMPAPYA
jgi:hypothetical protein